MSCSCKNIFVQILITFKILWQKWVLLVLVSWTLCLGRLHQFPRLILRHTLYSVQRAASTNCRNVFWYRKISLDTNIHFFKFSTLVNFVIFHVHYNLFLSKRMFVARFCFMCYVINLLKPTCHVMHQQFNIQQLYALPTLYLCVLYLSENKQRLVPLAA
jgi:hypothetical protein